MSNQLVQVNHLTKTFRTGGFITGKKLIAVDDVSLALNGERPTILSVVGESGSGKTTLARILLKLVEPTSGQLLICGRDIFHKSGHWTNEDFRKTVQPIFQNPFEAFSLYKPVDSYLYETAINHGMAKNKAEAAEVIAPILESMGLDLGIIRGKYTHQFSGGELQRISVARAMIPRPKLIIADEPVSMIDASMRMNLINLFLALKKDYSTSFIYITHDLSTAYYVSDFIAIMFRGNIVEYGPSNEVLTQPMHPYTELLMEAVPQVGQRWTEAVELPDLDIVEYSAVGCKFASRCPFVKDICRKKRPPMATISDNRRVFCYRLTNYMDVPEK